MKYLDISDSIKERIRSGEWDIGQKLPSDKILIREYETSQATITKSMELLEREGWIVRYPKSGKQVAPLDKRQAVRTRQYVVFIIRSAVNINDNPLNWFISEQFSRGIINANQFHIFRMIKFDELNKAIITREHNEKAFIPLTGVSSQFLDIIGNAPYVAINPISALFREFNSVNYDEIISIFNGVTWLIRHLKHRRIAMLWGGGLYHQDCLAGYRMALNMAGIPFKEDLVMDCRDGGKQEGYEGARQLLHGKQNSVTAIFADTDLKALGAMEYCREHGIKVPDDISILGSDDIPEISDTAGLSTVRRPFYEMGEALISLLDQRINYGKDIPSIPWHGVLVKRNSCTTC